MMVQTGLRWRGPWGHFWGHGAVVLSKLGKVDSDPAPTNVPLHKDTKPGKESSVSS
jgi:hypothetical protein